MHPYRHFWATAETTAPPEAVWRVWTDVPHWRDWDTGLDDAELSGAFVAGAEGTIRSGGRKSAFTVTEYTAGRSYTITTRLPLAALNVHRVLEPTEAGTRFTHEVWFSGFAAPLFAKLFGAKFRPLLRGVLTNVKSLAQ